MVRQLVDSGSVSEFEFKILNEQKGIRNCVTSLKLYRETGLLGGSIIDITERKQAEEEKEMMRVQLYQSQKMESVGQLAGGVAHDFNNMLGVILGHAEMAMDEIQTDHPVYSDLTEIKVAAERSASIVRQLLAFARKQVIAPKIIDLNAAVEGMLKMMRRLIGEDLGLVWKPGVNLWQVNIDPSQVDQILANLCVNARDAMPSGGSIVVQTENHVIDEENTRKYVYVPTGDYVLLSIGDTGTGIPTDLLAHIFEPFYTTKEVGKGTGLGLSTVYGIVKQNNGFIDVESKEGQGTTFRIYLPRHTLPKRQVNVEKESGSVESGNETILLVEDEPSIIKMASTMLERLGYKVLPAGIPNEAIRLAKECDEHIHLLITDVVMPEMNGKDMAETILKDHPGMKCLFMSGYSADTVSKQGVLEQGINFIQKPFSKNEFADKVRKVLTDQYQFKFSK
jgi:signal transduction histidine kinase/ActR/RegA family two-component response regulator